MPASSLRHTTLLRIGLVLATLLLTSCGADPTPADTSSSGCTVDGDCPTGQGCLEQHCLPILRDCAAQPCDGGPCRTASCDRFAGCSFSNKPANTGCGDNRCVTACDSKGACVSRAKAVTCPLSTACQTNACDPATGACTSAQVAAGTSCDDGDACTTGEVCNGATCTGGAAKDCDDKNACTQDGCTANGGCYHTPMEGPCDDGLACTPEDVCSGGQCVGKGATAFSDGYGTASDEEAYAVVPDAKGLTLVGWTETLGGSIRGWLAHVENGGKLGWQQTYGSGTFDLLLGAVARSGGGVLAVGSTDRNNDDDGWLLVTDATGATVADVAVTGKGADGLEAVLQTSTGAIAGGATGKKANSTDGWLVAFDSAGKELWQRSWGTAGKDRVRGLASLSKGFAAVGETTSTTTAGQGADTWVVQVGAGGSLQWQVNRGLKGDDFAASVAALPGGALLVAGQATVLIKGAERQVARAMRLDKAGKVVWERVFDSHKSRFTSVALSDGGAALVGDRADPGSKVVRAWLIRLDLAGNTAWQRTWSGGEIDRATHVVALADGLAVAGWGREPDRGDEAVLWRTDLWGDISCNDAATCGVAKPSLCSDGDPCTADACGAKGCDHPILPDGLPCGGGKTCQKGTCL